MYLFCIDFKNEGKEREEVIPLFLSIYIDGKQFTATNLRFDK